MSIRKLSDLSRDDLEAIVTALTRISCGSTHCVYVPDTVSIRANINDVRVEQPPDQMVYILSIDPTKQYT
jgi:hypothetical protein